eukprot:7218772-Prymnesium_polylepis.1
MHSLLKKNVTAHQEKINAALAQTFTERTLKTATFAAVAKRASALLLLQADARRRLAVREAKKAQVCALFALASA